MSDVEFTIKVTNDADFWWAWCDELNLGSDGCDTPLEALQEFNERLASEAVIELVQAKGAPKIKFEAVHNVCQRPEGCDSPTRCQSGCTHTEDK